LPTSLTYVVLQTRGFEPRRPAAVMSTTRFETARLPAKGCSTCGSLGFSRDDRCAPDPRRRSRALPTVRPYLGTMPFQGRPSQTGGSSKTKENSSQGNGRRLRVRLRCRTAFRPNSGSGILTPIPFRHLGDDLSLDPVSGGDPTPPPAPAKGSGEGEGNPPPEERREPIVAFHEVNLCLRID